MDLLFFLLLLVGRAPLECAFVFFFRRLVKERVIVEHDARDVNPDMMNVQQTKSR